MASRYGSIRIVEQGTTSGRKLESENIDAYDRLINKKKFLDFISPLAGHLKMIKTGGRNNRGCYGNMCCTRARHFFIALERHFTSLLKVETSYPVLARVTGFRGSVLV